MDIIFGWLLWALKWAGIAVAINLAVGVAFVLLICLCGHIVDLLTIFAYRKLDMITPNEDLKLRILYPLRVRYIYIRERIRKRGRIRALERRLEGLTSARAPQAELFEVRRELAHLRGLPDAD